VAVSVAAVSGVGTVVATVALAAVAVVGVAAGHQTLLKGAHESHCGDGTIGQRICDGSTTLRSFALDSLLAAARRTLTLGLV